jgi:hypothetical protein
VISRVSGSPGWGRTETSERALTIQAVKLPRFLARLDAWPHPTVELWVGSIVLVLSAGFWTSTGSDANRWSTVVGAILGPLLVYRAWRRKQGAVHCDTCGERAPIVEMDDKHGRFYVIDCPRCGLHAPPAAEFTGTTS